MYAIGFDLLVKEVEKHHPKGVRQAYFDIETVLNKFILKPIYS